MHKYKYEVLEENEDVMLTKIVKRNVDVEFTMQELKDHEERVHGILKELEAKCAMEKAAMENVEHFHGEAVALVKDLSPEKQHALYVYLRAFASVLEIEPKLEEVKKAFDEHNEEVKDIINQTGWIAPTVVIDPHGKKEKAQESTEGES